MMGIYESHYKDVKAVAMENGSLRALFLPECGGKLASLVQMRTAREFLVQAPGDRYRKLDYYGSFIDAECSGFDDMFPTIDSMYYAAPPWEGALMPGHGEVCRLKWKDEVRGESLHMAVHGVRFPYRLEKWASFTPDGALRIDYRAENLSGFDMDFLWAAHLMLNAEEGGEIIAPFESGQETVSMFSSGNLPVKYGDLIRWPVCERGSLHKDLSRTSLKGGPASYKHYFNGPVPEGWCAYRYPSDGTVFRLSFPRDKVPFLGLWVNEGGFLGHFNVALEACTGAFDRPDIARLRGMNSVMKAESEYRWHIILSAK